MKSANETTSHHELQSIISCEWQKQVKVSLRPGDLAARLEMSRSLLTHVEAISQPMAQLHPRLRRFFPFRLKMISSLILKIQNKLSSPQRTANLAMCLALREVIQVLEAHIKVDPNAQARD
jgi:hypothetical protein